MPARRPLTIIDGQLALLPAGDTLDAASSEVDVIGLNNGGAGSGNIGAPVYISSGGTFQLARANAAATEGAIGLIRDSSIAVAANGTIQTDGVLTASTSEWDAITGQTGGLTPGSIYFLSAATAGQLTTTAPTATGHYVRAIGRAISTTSLEISIQPSILL